MIGEHGFLAGGAPAFFAALQKSKAIKKRGSPASKKIHVGPQSSRHQLNGCPIVRPIIHLSSLRRLYLSIKVLVSCEASQKITFAFRSETFQGIVDAFASQYVSFVSAALSQTK